MLHTLPALLPARSRRRLLFVAALREFLPTRAQSQYQVTVLGAAGGIGQPLSLLLKLRPAVTKLNVYDLAHTKGSRLHICGAA